jgi:hypothetical protein
LANDQFQAKIETIPMPKDLVGYQKFTKADVRKLKLTVEWS